MFKMFVVAAATTALVFASLGACKRRERPAAQEQGAAGAGAAPTGAVQSENYKITDFDVTAVPEQAGAQAGSGSAAPKEKGAPAPDAGAAAKEPGPTGPGGAGTAAPAPEAAPAEGETP